MGGQAQKTPQDCRKIAKISSRSKMQNHSEIGRPPQKSDKKSFAPPHLPKRTKTSNLTGKTYALNFEFWVNDCKKTFCSKAAATLAYKIPHTLPLMKNG